VYKAYAVSTSTLVIANRELPAYQVDKSVVSGKLVRVPLTDNASISANTPNRVKVNTPSAIVNSAAECLLGRGGMGEVYGGRA
jgi:hypothetical protein